MSSGNEKLSRSALDQKEAVAVIVEALQLNHGRGFGVRYFSRNSHRKTLRELVSKQFETDPTAATELYEAVLGYGNKSGVPRSRV